MVEKSNQSRSFDGMDQVLDQAVLKLQELNEPKKDVSQQELDDLIRMLHDFNFNLNIGNLAGKKLVSEETDMRIESALLALKLFQENPQNTKNKQKNIDQTISWLVALLNIEIQEFDKNLRGLKKNRVGMKIEKSNKSKQS